MLQNSTPAYKTSVPCHHSEEHNMRSENTSTVEKNSSPIAHEIIVML